MSRPNRDLIANSTSVTADTWTAALLASLCRADAPNRLSSVTSQSTTCVSRRYIKSEVFIEHRQNLGYRLADFGDDDLLSVRDLFEQPRQMTRRGRGSIRAGTSDSRGPERSAVDETRVGLYEVRTGREPLAGVVGCGDAANRDDRGTVAEP